MNWYVLFERTGREHLEEIIVGMETYRTLLERLSVVFETKWNTGGDGESISCEEGQGT